MVAALVFICTEALVRAESVKDQAPVRFVEWPGSRFTFKNFLASANIVRPWCLPNGMNLVATKSESEVSSLNLTAQALPVSVIVPVRNEARNLPRCLESLANVGEVYVVDSASTDDTVAIARSHGGRYKGRVFAFPALRKACRGRHRKGHFRDVARRES